MQWKNDSKGGRRPKPKGGKRGRPKGTTESDTKALGLVEENLGSVVLPSQSNSVLSARVESLAFQLALLPERFLNMDESNAEIVCRICRNVLDRPMAVPVPGCEHACCSECWEHWLAVSLTCPICREAVATHQLQPLSRCLWQQLNQLQLHCDFWANGCDTVVPLRDLRQHAAVCTFSSAQASTSKIDAAARTLECDEEEQASPTVNDVIAAPLTQPVSGMEQKLLARLLRRLSYQHQSEVALPIRTGGRPTHVSILPMATDVSASVSDRTRRRRKHTLELIEKSVCGQDMIAQRAFQLSTSTQAEREHLLVTANIHHYVSPADSLALQVNLRLTNEQLRKLRLWTKCWRVHLAAERQAHTFAEEQMGDVEIGCELVQVTTAADDNSTRILTPAMFAWIKDPVVLLFQHLSSLMKRNLLT